MPRTNYRLRVEGVNLGNFVEDVQDLSTVRGGGLLMLGVPARVQSVAEKRGIAIDPVSTGASSGLFDVNCSDDEAKQLCSDLVDDFHKDDALRHATIAVDIIPASDDFIRDRESLIALNRWQQMTSPSLAVPSPSQKGGCCEFDLIRPATAEESGEPASASVIARRTYGKGQKNAFYLRELRRDKRSVDPAAEHVAETGFVHDLTELTGEDPSRKNLETKMAVIYFDGNKFGRILNRLCRSASDQRDYDRTIRNFRTAVLEQLLKSMDDDPDWMYRNKEKKDRHPKAGPYRLETLLWGGDEMIWVVPAWQGWRVVQLFYEASAKWHFRDAPLTHAGGIVFCHHKANIHRITKLSRGLAGIAKDVAKDADANDRNVFAYQVLESFDFVSGNLAKFRETRIPKDAGVRGLVLSGSSMATVSEAIAAVKARLPNNKLHDIVRGLRKEGASKEVGALIKTTVDDAFLDDESRRQFDSLMKSFGGSDTAWFHLAELWDYLPAPHANATSAPAEVKA